ncbi:uncharacterized protein [Aegilops tauschii subsp. strangulata]|uniref:uncharacterized protein n=1 Tax=Aegilops tauschii subsp. strangulata TaxID=200361 RepID=UPI00098B5ED5
MPLLLRASPTVAAKNTRVGVRHTPSHRSPPRHAPSAALSPLPLSLSRLAADVPPPHHHAAAPLGSFGYRGVRARPSGAFSAEIRSGNMCHGLGTFETAHEAARAYDAAAWPFRRPRRDMNFPEVPKRELAQELAPLLQLITDDYRRENRRRERRLTLAEMDEEAMELWRQCFPHDIINERKFFAQRRAEREVRRAERAAYR